jgi:alpha-tubulin suppressor-like RCC1 family protein
MRNWFLSPRTWITVIGTRAVLLMSSGLLLSSSACRRLELPGESYIGSAAERPELVVDSALLVDPAQVSEPFTFVAVSRFVDGYRTCTTSPTGRLYCWSGLEEVFWSSPDSIQFRSATLGLGHICGISVDGVAYCWNPATLRSGAGAGVVGECGTGDIGCVNTPAPVQQTASYQVLAAGVSHTCGLTSDGSLNCWGLNLVGELGVARAGDKCPVDFVAGGHETETRLVDCARTPIPVLANERFAEIAVGARHSCAVTVAREVYCWGYNYNGQLGVVSQMERGPVQLEQRLTDIAAGERQTCGLDDARRAYCWGWLGQGREARTPRQLLSSALTSITAGEDHVCGLTTDGSAICWGSNIRGQLGSGIDWRVLQYADEPVAVAGGLKFSKIVAGSGYTCGIANHAELYCWGDRSGYDFRSYDFRSVEGSSASSPYRIW